MPDPDVPAGEETAPAEAPATLTAEQISVIVAQGIKEGLDSRIAGMQSVYDKKLSELSDQLRHSGMDEDEIADERASTLEAQLAEAQRTIAIQQAGQAYPDALPVFQRITEASTAEDQLKVIDELVKKASAGVVAPAEEPDEEPEEDSTPPVDPNRPRQDDVVMHEGIEMNDSKAERILDAFGDVWPRFK